MTPNKAQASQDAKKVEAAAALQAKLDEVLNSANHRWYIDKMDDAEKEQRRNQMEEFRKRYEK